ncbi:MAG: VTT domain-containing protein [Terriglobia bacterium]
MDEAIQFLLQHGYLVLFVFVLAEQMGLPLPAIPALLAMGALAGAGQLSYPLALLTAVAASLLSDLTWYQLGRHRGHSVLNLLCRISLEPDSCVRRTQSVIARHGAPTLLFAKFVPGLNTVAPPLAGMIGMRLTRFALWDAGGAFFWAGGFSGLGYLFREQLERLAVYATHLGTGLGLGLGAALAAYLGWKYLQRQRFLRQLWIARITPEELKRKLEAGEDVVVVDLRHSLEFDADNAKIPGALHLLPEELDPRHQEIPRDREVVLYCT